MARLVNLVLLLSVCTTSALQLALSAAPRALCRSSVPLMAGFGAKAPAAKGGKGGKGKKGRAEEESKEVVPQ